nr:glycosyltransferase family A protein [uncultured Carboxylicivirga sp.]
MNKIFTKYLAKHPVLKPETSSASAIAIRTIIPIYLEEDYIDGLLSSLSKAAHKCNMSIEIVLVVNYSELAPEEIQHRQQLLSKRLLDQKEVFNDVFTITVINAFDLKAKHAGAGWARKIGMDYAVNEYAREENYKGIIVSLDADCDVQDNYFVEIGKKFSSDKVNGCTICFEHQTDDVSEGQKEAIMQYELHLRYYLQVLRWTGHPYAFHTVGSCFAVTAESYVRAGGMPRKQAGEDFYFLQKVIPLGNFSELNTTCVFPSSRVSDRVPFGTGPTIASIMESNDDYLTYNLQAFIDLKELFDIKEEFFKVDDEKYADLLLKLSGRIRSFLMNSEFENELANINNNCSSLESFKKRFFEVFDAFKVVKYLNYVHLHFLEKNTVYDASMDFLEMLDLASDELIETADILEYFRHWEKES